MVQYAVSLINAVQGMRKTLVMFILILMGIIFRVKGYINGDNVVDLWKGTAIAFFAANGLEHITSTVKEYINKKGQKVDETVLDVSEAK